MAKKLWTVCPSDKNKEHEEYIFHCEGCETGHRFVVRWGSEIGAEYKSKFGNLPVWAFNGSLEKPTFTPSLLVHGWKSEDPKYRSQPQCHLYVTDGKIQYLGDCGHPLAGKTVDLPDID